MNNLITVFKFCLTLLETTYINFYPFRFSLFDFFSFIFVGSIVALFIRKVFLDD